MTVEYQAIIRQESKEQKKRGFWQRLLEDKKSPEFSTERDKEANGLVKRAGGTLLASYQTKRENLDYPTRYGGNDKNLMITAKFEFPEQLRIFMSYLANNRYITQGENVVYKPRNMAA